jgi:hypothetical protein
LKTASTSDEVRAQPQPQRGLDRVGVDVLAVGERPLRDCVAARRRRAPLYGVVVDSVNVIALL